MDMSFQLLMLFYLKSQNTGQATSDEFDTNGFFKTGDFAEHSNGYYKILGSWTPKPNPSLFVLLPLIQDMCWCTGVSVDIIKFGGFKISALEVESVFLQATPFSKVPCFCPFAPE